MMPKDRAQRLQELRKLREEGKTMHFVDWHGGKHDWVERAVLLLLDEALGDDAQQIGRE